MSVGSLLHRSCLPSAPFRPAAAGPAGARGPAVAGATAAPGTGLAAAARPLANNSIWG
ncbi:hypothetical protein OG689_28080 [Kitasatospora sp. NBC_00240]|uniref:hypothetical protein n=1 Tax=Kitasatospora sp. NBC_00240 TaxID=2903567 RepID=UPI0022558ECB|nr:hypothetical protein [Kitasatospora sp. NBC_00240]MCX5213083.1 hypothetical protein [Kitasatospora sp. NBC_00240]